MSNKLRQQILKEIKHILNEVEYAGVSNQKERIAAGVKADPSIQRLVGGNGTPQDILAFVKSQADSNYINDDEARLMKDSVVNATAKCSKPQLSADELTWCQEYKNLAPQIVKSIQFKWSSITQTQQRYAFNGALDKAQKLNLQAPAAQTQAAETPATPAQTSPSATPAEASSGQTFGNSFTCRDPRIVGLMQKKMKLQPDCKIGQKTISSLISFGMVGKNLKFQDFFIQGNVSPETKQYITKNQQTVCKTLEDWATNPEAQAALPTFKCPATTTQPSATAATPAVKKESKMKNTLRQKILKEINNILEQVNLGTETEKAGGGNVGRTAAVGTVGLAAAPITMGLSLIPTAATMIASIVEGSPAELQDAIARCEKDPKALADLIKAQLASRYINDNESEAMVGVARAYQTHCKGGDTSWCKKVIQNFPDYKTEIQSKWSASNIGGQLKDKLELIRILEDFSGMEDTKPTPAPTPEPTPTPPEPDNGGGKGGKGKKCVRCKNVKKGCKGSVVKEIHDKLVALKLIPATSKEVASQTFGAETEKVIRDFQTAKKINLDGIVGKDTSKALGISCGKVDDKGNTEDTTPKCKDGTPAPGGDVSKCPPDSKPEPKPEPKKPEEGMSRPEAINKTYAKRIPFIQEEDKSAGIFQKAVKFLIDARGKTPQEAFDAVQKITGPGGSNVKEASSFSGGNQYNPKGEELKKKLENLTGQTISELINTKLQESKQFKYENYYDSKKTKEANILFERLINKNRN